MIYRMQVFYVVRRYETNSGPDIIVMKHGPFGDWDQALEAKESHRWAADKLEIMKQVIEVEVC